MTQEDKELLLKDLCARLPYGFTIHRYSDNCDIVIESNGIDDFAHFLEYSEGEDFKPYLRPMSSMTDEEFTELKNFTDLKYDQLELIDWNNTHKTIEFYLEEIPHYCVIKVFDWLNAHHFDYRGLIEKGLALEAPSDMYKIG